MIPPWKIRELVALLRQRYSDWEDFDHPGFVADELAYKHATIVKASEWLNEAECDRLLAREEYEEFINRLDRLGKDNNLLWRSVPGAGDLSILYRPELDHAAFCDVMRYLLYGASPVQERLHDFSLYAAGHGLPNRWPFPTYFLFLCHPADEIFVKPETMRWFLQFMGQGEGYRSTPSGEAYEAIRQLCHTLRNALEPYGARDMVDVQSFLWVCARESKNTTGGLTLKDRVELEYDTAAGRDAPAERLYVEPNPPYTAGDCAAETGFNADLLTSFVQAIERKGQAILFGPPGTGKTYLAEKLGRILIAEGDGFVELIQFHPAYAYEDFVQGIRPRSDPDTGALAYPLVPGRFLEFCQHARHRTGRCILVLDEINRANLSAVFGEIMVLLEYRDREIPLAGGGTFAIPGNVRLIGTMNTADRSVALVDHALRRRFAFLRLDPHYEVLRHYHAAHTGLSVEGLIETLQRLNRHIDDPLFAVGITFFLRPDLSQQLESIWRTEIEPYLEEYFFDRPDEVNGFRWEAVGKAINA